MKFWTACAVGTVAVSLACPANAFDDVAALVNGSSITMSELDSAFRQAKISDRAGQMPKAEVDRLKTRVLQVLINRELLNQHLVELKIPVDEKMVEAHIKQIEDRLTANGQTLESFLQKLGVTKDRMRSDIRHDYRWISYVDSQAKESVLRKYFIDNKEAFDGSQVRVRHLLIKAPEGSTVDQKELARRRASDLRARIADGEAFDKLAKEYSDCPSREKGGELPAFPRKAVMSEPFAKAAFELSDGQLSQVVESEFGYHLIVRMEKIPGTKKASFEESIDDVKTYYAEDLRKALTARLRSKGQVVVKFPKTNS